MVPRGDRSQLRAGCESGASATAPGCANGPKAGREVYIKFEHRSLGEPRWLDATPEAFTLHVYALDWCQEQASDGSIPDKVARRLSCPVDPLVIPAAWDALVALGAWVRDDDAYSCPDFLAHGIASEEQDATRAKWSADKRRRRLHAVGLHTLCTPRSCPVISSTSGQGEASPSVHHETSGRPDQTRPDPTPKGGLGMGIGVGSAGRDADASPDTPEDENPREEPSSPWLSVGDCPHMPAGRDVGLAATHSVQHLPRHRGNRAAPTRTRGRPLRTRRPPAPGLPNMNPCQSRNPHPRSIVPPSATLIPPRPNQPTQRNPT